MNNKYTSNSEVKTNSKYKDSLFRLIFGENKENALSLYNAVNGSHHTNVEDLEFTTLDDVIYMKMKNDVSFIFDKSLNLYEHQSSYNPNMPLKGLLYFADLYRQSIPKSERLYSRNLIKLPTPKYIVFYNGVEDKPDISEMRLSDAFEFATAGFEWTATVYNINHNRNKELLSACKILGEYSEFVERVRQNRKVMLPKQAIDKAVDSCIKDNILKNLLEKHRREVVNMLLTEFDEKEYHRMIKEEAYEEGLEQGLEQGKLEIILKLVQNNVLSVSDAAKEIGMSEIELRDKMEKTYCKS